MEWNGKDLQQIARYGQNPETVSRQIENFKTGFPPIKLYAAATVENHGIQCFSSEEIDRLALFFDGEAPALKTVLFVPASGAASRMFKSLFAFLNDEKDGQNKEVQQFFDRLPFFAFYDELKEAFRKDNKEIRQESYKNKAAYLLEDKGLNYGFLPKGLLLFHRYGNGNRLAVEEHLVEGALYGRNKRDKVYLHFTVSPEHKEAFQRTLYSIVPKYEKSFNVSFDISFSVQKATTDIMAVNPDNTPFRNPDGSLLFRPGGHGALIENLNDMDADIVFIKNIDNVVTDRLKPETIRYKKALGGLLIRIKDETYRMLNLLDTKTSEGIAEAVNFVENRLYIQLSKTFHQLSGNEKAHYLHKLLNRPIRVCGMVKNEGEPGGGPFFVENSDGTISLQIVESSQIDLKNSKQAVIAKKSTHFNPVDLACSIKNYKGKPFDLREFTDPQAGFISEKSKDGKTLKAQELPGLWNGAMAKWITLFVEVPLITFNPVKTVNDLLRPEHQ